MAALSSRFKYYLYISIILLIISLLINKLLLDENLDALFAIILGVIGILIAVINLKTGVIFTLLLHLTSPFLGRIIYYAIRVEPHPNLLSATAPFLYFVLLVIFIVKRLASERKIIESSLDLFVSVYLGLIVLQVFNPNQLPIFGVHALKYVGAPICLYFLAKEFSSKRNLSTLLTAFALYGAVSILYGLYQHFHGYLPFEKIFVLEQGSRVWFDPTVGFLSPRGYYKIFSFAAHNYDFFYPLSIFGVIFVSLKLTDRKMKRLRLLYLILLFILLLFELERGPAMMFLVGSIAVVSLSGASRESIRNMLIPILLLLVMWIIFQYYTPELAQLGGERVIRFSELSHPWKARTVVARYDLHWQHVFKQALSHPFGTGTGSYTDTYVIRESGLYGRQRAPHNMYLHILVELGIPGFLLFLLISICTFKCGLSYSIKGKDAFLRSLSTGILGAAVGMFAIGIVNIAHIYASGHIFWLLVGLLPNFASVPVSSDEGLNRIMVGK